MRRTARGGREIKVSLDGYDSETDEWVDEEAIAGILKEYRIISADVRINCDATPDELIDIIEHFTKCEVISIGNGPRGEEIVYIKRRGGGGNGFRKSRTTNPSDCGIDTEEEAPPPDRQTIGSAILGIELDTPVQSAHGWHGVHLHMIGDCSNEDFTSSGGHINPTGHEHGLLNAEGPDNADLPNIYVHEDGALRAPVLTCHLGSIPVCSSSCTRFGPP